MVLREVEMTVTRDGDFSVHAAHIVEHHSVVLSIFTHFVDAKKNSRGCVFMDQLEYIQSGKLLSRIFYHQSLIVREPLWHSDDDFIDALSSLLFGEHANILHHHGDYFFRIENLILISLIVVSRPTNFPCCQTALICNEFVGHESFILVLSKELSVKFLTEHALKFT